MNDVSGQLQAIIKSISENDADFDRGKMLVFRGLTILFGVRVTHTALSLIYRFVREALRPTDIFLGILSILILLFFANMIYKMGSKPFVILALIGGVTSLPRAYNDIITAFVYGDAFYGIVTIVSVIAALAQTGIMIFFIANGRCKRYFEKMSQAQKELQQWVKENRQK